MREWFQYLHQKDLVLPGCRDQQLHLPGVHGKWFLTQYIFPGVHEELTQLEMAGVNGANVHHIWPREEGTPAERETSQQNEI